MGRRSLILFTSMTGNTEKVAKKFQEVFEQKAWKCDIYKITKQTEAKGLPYYFDDYDLICLGSPIIAGLPTKEISRVLGLTAPKPPQLWRKDPFPNITKPYGPIKGMVFVTYAGGGRGPEEAKPALDVLRLYLEDKRIKCVGQFACCGKEMRHMAVDTIANAKQLHVEDAAGTLSRYMENPDSTEFSTLSAEERELFAKAAADNRDLPDYVDDEGNSTASRLLMWHHNQQDRPHSRDLLKAEIFLQEILEDYYEGGIEAASLAQYICIG